MALGGNTDYSDQDGMNGSTALGHQHGHRWWPRPQVAFGGNTAIDIYIEDLGYGRITDPDMVLSSNPDLGVIVIPGDSIDHSNRHGSSDANMAPGGGPNPGHPQSL